MSLLGAILSSSFLGLFAVTAGGGAWSPEQWAFLIAAIITSLGSAVAGVIAAYGVRRQRRDMKIPSNGSTPGAYLEAVGQILHAFIQLQHPDAVVPTPATVARELSEDK